MITLLIATLCIVAVITGIIIYYTNNTVLIKTNPNQVFGFKTSIELTGLQIIVFYQNNKKYNFLLDTGSNVSYINKSSNLQRSEVLSTDSFLSASGEETFCEIARIILCHEDKEYNYDVRVADLNEAFRNIKESYGVTLSGIIGCDFMEKYKYCLDFKEMVAYIRK